MKRSIDLLLLVIWITVIFFLTGFPGLEAPKIKEFPIDKFYHFLLFFIYGILGLRIMDTGIYFLSGVIIVIVAEVQQKFIPGRDFEILDMVAGVVGLITIYLIKFLKNKK
jgi:VanZ family protein|uniref:VanZ family protein n=1 Tax=candidate division WOR-3 bacterium TaxID=2052148 RepID=A0A7V3RIK8_UNCW3